MRIPLRWDHCMLRAVSHSCCSRVSQSWRVALLTMFSVFLSGAAAQGDVKLPALIGDNMVLQQGRQVAIWGTADAGEQVTVSLEEQKETATADASGRWKVELAPLKAGGPWEMVVEGKNKITIHNILAGEVWVCSGQSNMEVPLVLRPQGWSAGVIAGVINYEDEIARSNYPALRLFTVQEAIASKPQNDVKGTWVAAGPQTVGAFSAAGYFFGRDLQRVLKVPVGLISSSFGGSPVEAWMSEEAINADPDMKLLADAWRQRIADYPHIFAKYRDHLEEWEKSAEEVEASGKKEALTVPVAPPDPRKLWRRTSGLWNRMMAPLTSYAIAGVIWYQGEANAAFAYQYRKAFSTMIEQWRASWGEGDFPFLFVQLANCNPENVPADSWAVVRESQAKALALPKTAMAVAVDIGERNNIHPRNKQEVGRRLALAAEAVAYGRSVEYSGPTFESLRIVNGTLRLRFNHANGGLVARGGPVVGFQIAGDDQKFFEAHAKIEGNVIVLASPKVPRPVAARYAWANDPPCNLYNKANLPAPPFRTDDWPVPTQGEVRKEAL
jgi:sialate O-acetylesterase